MISLGIGIALFFLIVLVLWFFLAMHSVWNRLWVMGSLHCQLVSRL